ncbi:hypothetical protein [Paenibacillus borealis]|uniref:hypothetical protein n=1 Tax=Paenibacillus borealis TaxID=160799 RepID=UPI00069357F4|nr:hypothetical protein [Paenibacillus borealis]
MNGQTLASSPITGELPPSTAEDTPATAEAVAPDPEPSPESAVLDDMPSDNDTGLIDNDSAGYDFEDLPDEGTPSGEGVGEPIEFKYSMNSADAIKLTWEAYNLTGKTINYYTAHISTYNPVGDPSYDQLSGKSNFLVKYVGPVGPDETLFIYSDFTYQNTLDRIIIDQLTLQYDDGTTETFDYGYETTGDSGY